MSALGAIIPICTATWGAMMRTIVPAWVSVWVERGLDFLSADAENIYSRCVDVCLTEREIARLLNKRPAVTAATVSAKMARAQAVQAVTSRCRRQRDEVERAKREVNRMRTRCRAAAGATDVQWWLGYVAGLLSAAVAGLWGGWMAGVVIIACAAAAVLLLEWRGHRVWSRLWPCVAASWWGLGQVAARLQLSVVAAAWGEVLRQHAMQPVVKIVVRRMLGEDPDSLLMPDSYAGLRSPRGSGWIVSSAPAEQLKRKMAQLDAGTIAVCGPRGAGKTTMLESAVAQADFGLVAQAPATYAPHDFLLSLSVRLCQHYIRAEGYLVPELARLSNFRRLLNRAAPYVRKTLRWTAFALPAAALITLGMASTVRSTRANHQSAALSSLHTRAHSVSALASDIWQGHTVTASVMVTGAGILWWAVRRSAWLFHLLRQVLMVACTAAGIALFVAGGGSFITDPWFRSHVVRVPSATAVELGVLAVGYLWCAGRAHTRRRLDIGALRITMRPLLRIGQILCAVKFVQVFIRTPQTYALLGERENLWRLGALIAGYALIRLGSWQPQPAEPPLVTRCRNHLYRLQTIQMSSATMSAGTSQILSLGSEHSTSVTTVPPNFPELVADFRDLLTRIAEQHSQRGQRVVIAIDEVDRLGSDTQALAFLSEIKAILGVANVHYLISVAEDVGAAFVRRGLPHRDVTDSSLDDVVYVQPNTLDEARAILTKRAPGLSSPYVMLAHALSGGVPRDLIRYALRIMEMKDKADSSELVDISHYLVVEELSETLAGFRTLLSKCQWTAETSTVLQSFRTLGDYLRHSCPCTFDGLRHALEDFAFGPRPGSHTPRPVDNIARQMIDEASTYAYFSLTLLDIFSNTELTRRLQAAAARGPAGDPEQLAEARSELGISAYSARDLTTSIRQAWALPTQPLPTATVPPPRVSACDIH